MGGPGTGRRLVALPLAWLAGVAWQLRERELMPLAADVALAAIALAAVALLVWRPAWRRYLVVVAAGALARFASAGWQASLRLAETLPTAIEGRDIVVTGSSARPAAPGSGAATARPAEAASVTPGGATGITRGCRSIPEATPPERVARTLLPSASEAAHDSRLRRDAGHGRRGARALRRI
jgi:hypothetical protein